MEISEASFLLNSRFRFGIFFIDRTEIARKRNQNENNKMRSDL